MEIRLYANDCMASNEDLGNQILIYSQIVTGFLFCISEFLGMSECEYNGILHFIFTIFHRRIYVDIRLEQEVEVQRSSDSFHTASSFSNEV